jgi:hypothetical protein
MTAAQQGGKEREFRARSLFLASLPPLLKAPRVCIDEYPLYPFSKSPDWRRSREYLVEHVLLWVLQGPSDSLFLSK